MNAEYDRNDQPSECGSPEDAAAKLAHWELVIESVQSLSPELKAAWFQFKHLPDATSHHRQPPGGPQSACRANRR